MLSVLPDYRAGSDGRPQSPGEHDAARPLRKPVANGLTITLNIISLAFAIGLIFAMFFISQSIRDVASLEGRLAQLPKFEGRLSGQMDTLGVGVHSQFDKLNRRITTLIDRGDQLQKKVEELAGENRKLAGRLGELEETRETALATLSEPAEESQETVLYAPAPPPGEVRPKPQRPSNPVQFEKTVSPDGKVTYSKVR